MVPKTSSGRWLAGIAAAVIGLILASVLATLLAGSEVQTLPEGSPERATQEYLLALQEGQYRTAYELIAPGAQENCSLEEFERSNFPDWSGVRVRLDSVRMTETGAEVAIRITQINSMQPIPSEYTSTQRYHLREFDGQWRLTVAPWPYHSCYRWTTAAMSTPIPLPAAVA